MNRNPQPLTQEGIPQASFASQHKETLKALARVAAAAIALAIAANIEVPLYPVPITLQILALGFIAATLRPRKAFCAVASYIALGACGVPVFSGGMAGAAWLLGPTGGFILGFALAAPAASWLLGRISQTCLPWIASCLVSMVAMTGIVYLFGWAQLMAVAHLDPAAAFAAGVAPFLAVDLLKAGIVSCTSAAGRLAWKKSQR